MMKTKIFAFLLLFFLPLQAKHPSIVKEEFIFTNPPFASCHASTITETNAGTLLCAYFAGSEEGAADVAIWLSIFNGSWDSPHMIAQEEKTPCWNPVLFTKPSGEILLFYKVGKNPKEWSGLLKRSFHDGSIWTEAQGLPAGVVGPVKNKPLLLENGTLLCGSSIESFKRWGCWIDITTDDGKSWSKSTPINLEQDLFGIIQPTLFYAEDGTIQMLARSHKLGLIVTAFSHDQGRTWPSAKPTTLPNPNSAIDAVNITDGRIVLVYNHSDKNRYPLNIALSKDKGQTWTDEVALEDAPGEYSYPSIIQTKDGKIHITYTWNRKLIKHVVIDPLNL